MSLLGSALTNKISKTKDFLTGTRRLDNSKDPTSAYSMMKRKQANTLPRDKQKGATPGRL